MEFGIAHARTVGDRPKMTVGWPDGSSHKQRTGGALRVELDAQSPSPAGPALCARAARSRRGRQPGPVPGAGVRPRAAHRSVLDVFHETTITFMEYAISCCIKVTARLRMGAHDAQGDGSEVRLRRNLGRRPHARCWLWGAPRADCRHFPAALPGVIAAMRRGRALGEAGRRSSGACTRTSPGSPHTMLHGLSTVGARK